jgi:hypothetical protein
MTVFNVERPEHAARIARKEIGQRLENIPLEVLEVEVVDEDEAEGSSDEEESEAEEPIEEELDLDVGLDEEEEDDVLPEFEELVDEER